MNNDIQQYQPVSYPFINSQTLRNYIGKEVTLMGKIISDVYDADVFDVLTSDHQSITVYHNAPFSANANQLVMIRGQGEDLNGTLSLRSTFAQQVLSTKEFDLDVFNQFVNLAEGKFRDLFYD